MRELTPARWPGLALVIIAALSSLRLYRSKYLPGFSSIHRGSTGHASSASIYTDAGILGPTTAVSSTYIILFIIFAAFLQASKVGDYFVNFRLCGPQAARVGGAGHTGGPRVPSFASGPDGAMINGTSAGLMVVAPDR